MPKKCDEPQRIPEPATNIFDLWHSSDTIAWEHALQRYWDFVQPRNLELEQALDALDLRRIQRLSPQEWYDFLHDEYFRWKYTAANRYATTTFQLKKYVDAQALGELDNVRQRLLRLNLNDVRAGLKTAKEIKGLGIAGASGLLSLMYPQNFATVDQFVVKALMAVPDLPEANALANMNPKQLRLRDGVLLISILARKADENNLLFGTRTWTPRKIDMVLWTFGR